MNKVVFDIIILVGIVCNLAYTRMLERDIEALKSWIEVFWKVDFDAIARAIEEENRSNGQL